MKLNDFRTYVVTQPGCPNEYTGYTKIGWKGKREDGEQIGSVWQVPEDNLKEFIQQLTSTLELIESRK